MAATTKQAITASQTTETISLLAILFAAIKAKHS